MKKFRTLSALLALLAVFTLLIPIYEVTAASEGTVINKTVNLADVSKNARGAGFEWANLTNTLTLDGLNINTFDEFGMKLPKDATVILNGNNYITASSVGLVCTGQVTFEGTGTLTITAGDVGIDMTGVHTSHLARFRAGTITVTAGKTAIHAGAAELSFMGSKLSLTVNGVGANGKAIDGRTVNISAGSLTANAAIYASNALNVTSVNATVNAIGEAALSCPNGIKITKVEIDAGSSPESLTRVDRYNGESSVKLSSTASHKKRGKLFDGKYPVAIDYLIFSSITVAVAALVAVPIYLKKRRTQKLIEQYEAARAAIRNANDARTQKNQAAPKQSSQSASKPRLRR